VTDALVPNAEGPIPGSEAPDFDPMIPVKGSYEFCWGLAMQLGPESFELGAEVGEVCLA
jgi:hypothetical protein